MVHFLKRLIIVSALCFFGVDSFANPPIYGPLQAQNNLNDVDSASTSLSNIGGLSSATAATTYAPLANPTFTGTATIPIITASGGTINGTSIGGTTASTGKFTTLQATGTVTGIGLIGIQTFCSSGCSSTGGTYTPDSGTQSVIVDVQAPGGGGAGSVATGAGQSATSGGGSGGSYARIFLNSGFSGVTVTVPQGGTAGAIGSSGGTASTASFGSFASCPGGNGAATSGIESGVAIGGNVGVPSTCTISGATTIMSISGGPSPPYIVLNAGSLSASGPGGFSELGSGGQSKTGATSGLIGNGYGSGGSGGNTPSASSAGQTGGAGAQSIIIIYEYN